MRVNVYFGFVLTAAFLALMQFAALAQSNPDPATTVATETLVQKQ
jgi:hypothetical protein